MISKGVICFWITTKRTKINKNVKWMPASKMMSCLDQKWSCLNILLSRNIPGLCHMWKSLPKSEEAVLSYLCMKQMGDNIWETVFSNHLFCPLFCKIYFKIQNFRQHIVIINIISVLSIVRQFIQLFKSLFF